MSENNKIIGVTVGTPLSLSKIKEQTLPFVPLQITSKDGSAPYYILEIGKEYKIYAPKTEDGAFFNCNLLLIEAEDEIENPLDTLKAPCDDILADSFTLKMLGWEGGSNTFVYEYNDVLKSIPYDDQTPQDIQLCIVFGATTVLLCNPDAISSEGNGKDGLTPYIKDGNWWIGETDTGVKAEGVDGKDGVTIASILENDDETAICFSDGTVVDIKHGKDGKDGIDGKDGEKGEKGDKGDKGDKGEQGEQGIQGIQGEKGDTYTLTSADKTEIAEQAVKLIDGVPSYWQTHLNERVEDIRRAMETAGRNKSSFFFYSDSHWDNDSTYTAKLAPTLLKYLYKNTPINKTNYGGDIVSAESTDTDIMAYLWDWRTQLRGLPNHHSVIGNHDDGNSTDRLLSKEYIYSYLLAPEESNDIVWGGDFYYYIDDKSEKTRYLYLDIFYDRVSEAQTTFVSEALKSTPTDWHIVAICHAWFANDYTTYPPILVGLATEMQPILDMFDNYNARSGEFGTCGGWVELCIGGHYHLDYYEHTSGGIPVIIFEADTLHDRGGTTPQKNTTDEATVSAVVVDYNSNVVKVIRVGRGDSYEVPINFSKASYTNVIPLSIDKDGNIFNSGKGWADNSRIGSGGIYMGNQTGEAAQWVTGYIEIDPNTDNTFRLKNVEFNRNSTSTYHGIAFWDSSFAQATYNGTLNWRQANALGDFSPTYDSDGNVTEFTLFASKITNKNVKYIAICCSYIGDDSIITINEPIE